MYVTQDLKWIQTVKFKITIDLTEPIDVFYEWIDKCQEANMLNQDNWNLNKYYN